MTFYHKALIDGSECYQVQGYFESMSPEEAAKKNSRARKYAYVIARTTPFKATDCVGKHNVLPWRHWSDADGIQEEHQTRSQTWYAAAEAGTSEVSSMRKPDKWPVC